MYSFTDPPSPATNFRTYLPLAAVHSYDCYGAIYLSWIPGDSDRAIDMYELRLNGAKFASVTRDYHFYGRIFQLDVNYTYSVVAMSCAGNSTSTVSDVVSIESWLHARNTVQPRYLTPRLSEYCDPLCLCNTYQSDL